MRLMQHSRWNWIMLGTIRGNVLPTLAFITDDFGNTVKVSWYVTRISLRTGDA